MPADPRRVKDLFAAALDLADGPDRQAFLDRECRGDPALRGRLDALLLAHDHPDSLLDRPLADPAGTRPFVPGGTSTGDPPDQTAAGTLVAGRYKLLECVGEGGMGSVWMAEQREPVKRLVALKLVKAGMDSRQVLARFEAERQALALMDHPNIAKVLDGGTTAEGRPYFVMELVKGLPLTDYCDARRLTVRDRLELFAQVCSAVQHAHQKGVIHRDLKPSNVLVTEHDGKPVPKVIDFGLAKALHGAGVLTDKTLHTAYGAVVGTPLYMAPEQVGINALDVDTRTDIYALGVMLYELLTGTTPLEKKRFREAAWDEMKRVIREEEPPRPSTRLSTSDALPSLAAGRQSEPARLTKLVRGEIDWIVMKALEKDRNRRYETANGFAADVRRYLAGEEVLAVPPSAGYRVRKFVRRNRRFLDVAAGMAVLIACGVGGTVYGLVAALKAENEAWHQARAAGEERDKANDARRDADRERQAAVAQRAAALAEKARADAAAARAVAVNDFLTRDLLAQSDPRLNAVGDKVTVREVLDRAAAAVDGNRAVTSQPEVEVSVRGVLGNAYLSLGLYARAAPLLRRAADLSRLTAGADDDATVSLVNDLAAALRQLGELDEAATLSRDVLDRRRRLLGPDDPKTVSAENNVGVVLRDQGKYEVAEALFRSCRGRVRLIPGFDESEKLHVTANLAWVLQAQGNDPAKSGEAARLLGEAMPDFIRVWGANSPKTFTAMDSLGSALQQAGRSDEAVGWYRSALAGRRHALGEDHDETLSTRNNLALVLQQAGKPAEAEAEFRAILATKSTTGAVELRRPFYLYNLGLSVRDQHRYDEAERYIRESYDLFRRRTGPASNETLSVAGGLLDLQVLGGRWAAAEAILLDLLPAVRANSPPGSSAVTDLRYRLGWARLMLRKCADAEPDLRAGLAAREKGAPGGWSTFNARSLVGGAVLGQQRYTEAEPLLLVGYRGMKDREAQIPSAARLRLPEAADRLVELYAAWGKPAEAATWRAERAKYGREQAPPPRAAK